MASQPRVRYVPERSRLAGVLVVNAIREQLPLAEYTTLRLGGSAERMIIAETEADLVAAVRSVTGQLLVLAGGSNVVVSDQGFPGTVVLVRTTGIAIADQQGADRVTWRVAAGEPWDDVCAAAVTAGLSGIECLSGVPGSAGATPVQNVGAYGQEIADRIVGVLVYDRQRDEIRPMTPEACHFTYRSSVFKRNDRYVLLSVDLSLSVDRHSMPIRYGELARALDVDPGARAPLDETRQAVLSLRASKGMVLDEEDPDTRSVGSFFTNPVLDLAAMERLRRRAAGCGEVPAWPVGDGTFKTSAAWLIERAGFLKGYTITDGTIPAGTVAISGKHTLALTHRGGGTTDGLLRLARAIRDGVDRRFGVRLDPECVMVGCAL
ncbi:MAG: UDP-N-acetylmuramate dehydrogenase [Micromonosporaceae bacterium]|nr:UDP-N-acetylmuramate dehydrogenase [Micromonosporaceae bacterium]